MVVLEVILNVIKDRPKRYYVTAEGPGTHNFSLELELSSECHDVALAIKAQIHTVVRFSSDCTEGKHSLRSNTNF